MAKDVQVWSLTQIIFCWSFKFKDSCIHVIWFIWVFSKYPVLGTLNYFDEIQYWKPLKNP